MDDLTLFLTSKNVDPEVLPSWQKSVIWVRGRGWRDGGMGRQCGGCIVEVQSRIFIVEGLSFGGGGGGGGGGRNA